MKKIKLKHFMFSFILLLGITSQVFLHNLNCSTINATTSQTDYVTEFEKVETEDEEELLLPDVKLVKTLLQIGSKYLPAAGL